jgi:hypothetical protein
MIATPSRLLNFRREGSTGRCVGTVPCRGPGLVAERDGREDAFHALRLFHQTIDEIRRRTAWAIDRRRGRRTDDTWRGRHLLLKAYERLTDRQRARLFSTLAGPEDPDVEIGYAYVAKEQARDCWDEPSIGRW